MVGPGLSLGLALGMAVLLDDFFASLPFLSQIDPPKLSYAQMAQKAKKEREDAAAAALLEASSCSATAEAAGSQQEPLHEVNSQSPPAQRKTEDRRDGKFNNRRPFEKPREKFRNKNFAPRDYERKSKIVH